MSRKIELNECNNYLPTSERLLCIVLYADAKRLKVYTSMGETLDVPIARHNRRNFPTRWPRVPLAKVGFYKKMYATDYKHLGELELTSGELKRLMRKGNTARWVKK